MINEYEQETSRFQLRINEYQEENEELEERCNNFEYDKDELEEKINNIEYEKQKLEMKINEYEEENEDFKEKIIDIENENECLEFKINEYKEENKLLEDKIIELEEPQYSFSSYNHQEEFQDKIEELNNRNDALKYSNERLRGIIDSRDKEIDTLSNNNNELCLECDRLFVELERLKIKNHIK